MTIVQVEPHKSSLGMDANIAILIAYLGGIVLGWIPYVKYAAFLVPLIVFILEKESKFVRFHAMQSFVITLIGLAYSIIVLIITAIVVPTSVYSFGAALGILGAIGVISIIVSLVLLVLVVIAVIHGFQYKEYRIPGIGSLAARMSQAGEGMFHKGT